MRIAYIISAYHRPDQLIRLINALYTPMSVFVVHVDKRTDKKIYRAVVSRLNHLSNIMFLDRHDCHWGDFGHVHATLKGLRWLFLNDINFDYVFLLTGQDYPIKPIATIETFLSRAKGQEFLEYFPLPVDGWQHEDGGLSRIERWHFRFFNKELALPLRHGHSFNGSSTIISLVNLIFPKRNFPEKFKPFGGSSYWSLTRECAKFIDEFAEKNPKFVKFFKHVRIPDEIFFQTVILNSHFAQNVVNDNLRYMVWAGGPGPQILRREDLQLIIQSKALIARKFDSVVDSEILDLIDSKLLCLNANQSPRAH